MNELVIESNVPRPLHKRRARTSPYWVTLPKMKSGDSFTVLRESQRNAAFAIAKKLGIIICSSREFDGKKIRVWRIK